MRLGTFGITNKASEPDRRPESRPRARRAPERGTKPAAERVASKRSAACGDRLGEPFVGKCESSRRCRRMEPECCRCRLCLLGKPCGGHSSDRRKRVGSFLVCREHWLGWQSQCRGCWLGKSVDAGTGMERVVFSSFVVLGAVVCSLHSSPFGINN
jgi:hypothetical protein